MSIKHLLEKDKVIILWSTPFCEPCKPTDSALQGFVDRHNVGCRESERIHYAKLDAVELRQEAAGMSVMSFPTAIFLHNGERVATIQGSKPDALHGAFMKLVEA